MKNSRQKQNLGCILLYSCSEGHLNNVFSARLLSTRLNVDSVPGIEYLEYLTPKNGRPMISE